MKIFTQALTTNRQIRPVSFLYYDQKLVLLFFSYSLVDVLATNKNH